MIFSVNNLRKSLIHWYRIEKQKKRTKYQFIFIVVGKIFIKLYRLIGAFINDFCYIRFFNYSRFERFQFSYQNKLKNHFYIIVTPGALHFVNVCLSFIPKELNLIILLNGTKAWEERYVREKYPQIPCFALKTFPFTSFSHGRLLDFLLDNNRNDFGVMDYDLFIFNEKIFSEIRFNKGEYAVGMMRKYNREADIVFPATHLIFFNVKIINEIRKKYHIKARIYRQIPKALKEKLLKINIGYHNFLKDYLDYFDPLNLIMAMCFYEKLVPAFLEINKDEFYHLGQASFGVNSIYKIHVNIKLLELTVNEGLRGKYRRLYEGFESSRDVLNNMSDSGKTNRFINRFNHAYERILKKDENDVNIWERV